MGIQEEVFICWLRRSSCLEQSSCERHLLGITLLECFVTCLKCSKGHEIKTEVENEVKVLEQVWRHGLCFKQLTLFCLWYLPASERLASWCTRLLGVPRHSTSAVESKYLIQIIDPAWSKHGGNVIEMLCHLISSYIFYSENTSVLKMDKFCSYESLALTCQISRSYSSLRQHWKFDLLTF
jgi:hypothetical protein